MFLFNAILSRVKSNNSKGKRKKRAKKGSVGFFAGLRNPRWKNYIFFPIGKFNHYSDMSDKVGDEDHLKMVFKLINY